MLLPFSPALLRQRQFVPLGIWDRAGGIGRALDGSLGLRVRRRDLLCVDRRRRCMTRSLRLGGVGRDPIVFRGEPLRAAWCFL